jgi:4-hydroxy-tetrahydrodipicolinate synthase
MNGKPIADGVWVAMVTPYTKDNKIDYHAVKQMIDWYARCKVDGLFAVCQSSEMHIMTLEERVNLSDFVVKNTPKHMGVVSSGHISDSIEDQIAELKAMAKTDPDALILSTNRLALKDESDEVWKANCKILLDALPGVTLGLYECPTPYQRLLSPELLKWCAETGRFVYMKDVCCNVEQISAKLNAIKGSNLKVFTADTVTLYDSLQAGAAGYCGIMANIRPEIFARLIHHWKEDKEKAAYLQHFATLTSLIADLMYPVCAKYHLQLEGVDIGLITRNRDYASFSEMDKLYVQQIHALWKEEALMKDFI